MNAFLRFLQNPLLAGGWDIFEPRNLDQIIWIMCARI